MREQTFKLKEEWNSAISLMESQKPEGENRVLHKLAAERIQGQSLVFQSYLYRQIAEKMKAKRTDYDRKDIVRAVGYIRELKEFERKASALLGGLSSYRE
jgi:predicted RND superfamily exporter protein